MAMKPIETRYSGFMFRSRTEARYAVMLDALGIKWTYEPEGYEFDDGTRYLPDFFIDIGNGTYGPYIEIKGQAPTAEEIRKLRKLCEEQCAYGLLISGAPGAEAVISIHKEGHIDDTDADLWAALDVPKWRYKQAVEAAKSARFEHGQSGAMGVWVPAHG